MSTYCYGQAANSAAANSDAMAARAAFASLQAPGRFRAMAGADEFAAFAAAAAAAQANLVNKPAQF